MSKKNLSKKFISNKLISNKLENNKFINRKNILVVIAIFWMGVIIYFSSRPAVESALMSKGLRTDILRWIERVISGDIPGYFERALRFVKRELLTSDHYLRKLGHIIVYGVLGFIMTGVVRVFGKRWRVLLPVLICFIFAVTDEVHQSFVPGRGPGLGDVILDTVAATTAVLLVNLVITIKAKRD